MPTPVSVYRIAQFVIRFNEQDEISVHKNFIGTFKHYGILWIRVLKLEIEIHTFVICLYDR